MRAMAISSERKSTRPTASSLRRPGIFPINVFGFELPIADRMMCSDNAALRARKGYAGYMNRSSLCGCAVKIPSHM